MDNHSKSSFPPLSTSNTTILILGSLPGDRSLELGEYYGHARNRFWRIIAEITNNELPVNFPEKKELLKKLNIGIWDVTHTANRIGSLDSAIKNVEPNDLDGFIAKHRKLKVIGFNGMTSQKLYDKYFERKKGIRYILLPSSSPANAGINFENICKAWQQLFEV